MENGSVVERCAYTPYGRATILEADFSADGDHTSDLDNQNLYTGREHDPETREELKSAATDAAARMPGEN